MDSGWTWASRIFGLLKPIKTKQKISVGPQVKKINAPTEWRIRLALGFSVQFSMVKEVGKCLQCFQGKKVYHKTLSSGNSGYKQRQKIGIFICAGIPISMSFSYRRTVETMKRLKEKQLVRTLNLFNW